MWRMHNWVCTSNMARSWCCQRGFQLQDCAMGVSCMCKTCVNFTRYTECVGYGYVMTVTNGVVSCVRVGCCLLLGGINWIYAVWLFHWGIWLHWCAILIVDPICAQSTLVWKDLVNCYNNSPNPSILAINPIHAYLCWYGMLWYAKLIVEPIYAV